jgi:hypothetical protein
MMSMEEPTLSKAARLASGLRPVYRQVVPGSHALPARSRSPHRRENRPVCARGDGAANIEVSCMRRLIASQVLGSVCGT